MRRHEEARSELYWRVDLRPVTEGDLVKREDELCSGEELDPIIVDAATRRKTRVGGASMGKEDRRANAAMEAEKDRCREAMARRAAARGEGASRNGGKRKKPAREGALKWDEKGVRQA